MTRKLVRLALAMEATRTPIRRQMISEKVLENTHRRSFNVVLERAQEQLRSTFGMELAELPARDVPQPITTKRKAAPKTSSSSNKSYVLVNILPPALKAYRTRYMALLDRMAPEKRPKHHMHVAENAYSGVATAILSIIYMSGGQISQAALSKHMRLLDLETTTVVDKDAEELLKTMIKHGYIDRVRDEFDSAGASGTGDPVWLYCVGPRGKVEVDEAAVIDFITSVYGTTAPDNLREFIIRAMRMQANGRARAIDADVREEDRLPVLGTQKRKPTSRRERAAALERDDNGDAQADSGASGSESDSGSDSNSGSDNGSSEDSSDSEDSDSPA
ncbi:MAGE family-domain-containing protein [Dipodascopsis tothii]|uniref:MAGE family-domain-containing protein n=1 Tax=Dipodascopsis tothii TaxID=44089 RepID=UPI0034CEA628